MRDRLIELINQADEECKHTKDCKSCSGYGKGALCMNYHIADRLLANGVVCLPCKVGSEVFYIIDSKIQALRVDYGTFGEIGLTMRARCKEEADMCEAGCWLDGKTCGIEFGYSHIGKTIFLTKEEAEKALAERSKG